jgi:hypothetical protein
MQRWSWASFRAGAARRGIPDSLLIATAAVVVVLISLVLPWYRGTVIVHAANGTTLQGTVLSGAQLSGTTSAPGAGARGWRYLILLVGLIELLYLLGLALWTRRPGFLSNWLQLSAALAALLLALAFAAFLLRPAARGPDFGLGSLFTYKVTDVAGPYVATTAALAALIFIASALREADARPGRGRRF